MRRSARAPEARAPQFPLRPGRTAFSKRTRLILAAVLVGSAAAALVVGGLLAGSSKSPLRSVTIPAADRKAPPALLLAAERVNFRPLGLTSAVGKIEDAPAAAAPAPPAGLLPVGSQAPGFRLRTPAGTVVSASALRGKAVLLEFFATWCPHCAAEAPHLHDLYASLPHAKVAFVGIDANREDAPSVLAFHIYFGLQFPALLDPSGSSVTFPTHGSPGPVSKAYRVTTFPTFYVLDPDGRIVWRSSGEQPDATLRQELRHAAGGSAPASGGRGAASGCSASASTCAGP